MVIRTSCNCTCMCFNLVNLHIHLQYMCKSHLLYRFSLPDSISNALLHFQASKMNDSIQSACSFLETQLQLFLYASSYQRHAARQHPFLTALTNRHALKAQEKQRPCLQAYNACWLSKALDSNCRGRSKKLNTGTCFYG